MRSTPPPIWRPERKPVNLGAFLRSRLAWQAGLGFAVVLALLLVDNYTEQLHAQHKQTEQTLLGAADTLARTAEGKYEERRRSVLFLANTPPVSGLVRALQGNGFDAVESSTTSLWTRRLEDIFTAFLTATPEASQIRFITAGDGGMELVRAERLDGGVVLAPPGRRQRRGTEAYLIEALRQPPGRVFVSDIDLTRNNGQVDVPHRPTIRYATPVHDEQGRVFGAIVINIDLSGRLGMLPPGNGPQLMVYATNAQGHFLAHPDPSLAFGFDLGQPHRWADQFTPAPAADVTSNPRVSWWAGPTGTLMAAQARVEGNPGSPIGVLHYTVARPESELRAAALHNTWASVPPLMAAGGIGAGMLYLYWLGVQRKLRWRAERLQIAAIVDQSPDAIVGLDNEGRVTSWNRGAERLFGHTPPQALGHTLDTLIVPPGSPSEEMQALRNSARTDDTTPMELWRQTREGQPVLVAVMVSPLRDERGATVGAALLARDVTDERAAQRRVVELKEGLEREVNERTAALAHERERLDNILRGTDAGTWEWNVQTGETRFNERWAEIIGRRLADLQPTTIETWMAHTHPDDLALSDQRLLAHFRGERDSYECEARMRHRDGHWVWIVDRGRVRTWTADGLPEWMYGTHQDISESKQAQTVVARSEALLRGAIDAVDEAFVLYDPDDRLLFCNEKYRQVYPNLAHLMVPGATFESIIRTGAAQGTFEDAVGREEAWVTERLRVHRSANAEFVQRLATGRTMRIVERRMPDGHIVGFRIDITDLVAAKEQAQEASRIKGEFLANMSHEIRTPLNAMIGMTYLLGDTPLTRYQSELLAKSRVASRSLLGLVNDVLDLAKIEAGGLELDIQPFSPQDMLGEMDALFRAQTEASGVRYTVSLMPGIPAVLLGDAQRVRQIFTNLIGNACKFTASGSVSVTLSPMPALASDAPDQVRLRGVVRDTGSGIDSETRARLFTPFTQADTSSTRRFSGTGLGLSIVRKLTQMMGGQVGLTSVPGEGSEFWFELVLKRPSAQDLENHAPPMAGAPTGSAARDPSLRHLNLLLVDDSEINLEVAAGLLQREGARVCLARTGREALEALRTTPTAFDAVLMDLQMPEMDGLEATRRVRIELGLGELPIIALTAGALAEERALAFAAGMNGFLTKPIDPERLVSTVHACVRRTPASADAPDTSPARTPAPAGWPHMPGVDIEQAAQRLGGDLDLWLTSLRRLLGEHADWMQDTTRLPDGEDARLALAARLHKLRGMAGTLGIAGLMDQAQALEAGLRQSPDATGLPEPDMVRLWHALQGSLTALQQHSEPVFQAAQAPRDATRTKDPGRALDDQDLAPLLALLQRQDLDALSWWREHAQALQARLGITLARQVGHLLDELDFAGASVALTKEPPP